MTVRQSAWLVAIFGLSTTFMLLVGADTIGGVMSLIQLCFLVGAPLAYVLYDKLRSWQVVVVVAAALSIALSAISVQFLIWFRIATPELLVITATAYGVVLALLFSSADLESDDPQSTELDDSTSSDAVSDDDALLDQPAPPRRGSKT